MMPPEASHPPTRPRTSRRGPPVPWPVWLGLLVLLLPVLPRPAVLMAAPSSDAWYEVRPGDMLSLIGARFGCSVGRLRSANGLRSDLIRPGQRLRLPAPFSHGGGQNDWRCPLEVPGRVLRGFGPHEVAPRVRVPHTGIDLQTSRGTRVYCPAHGVVRYVGPQEDFGTLVIIEHAGDWSTVLAPLAPGSVRVALDQAVLAGDLIGLVGEPEELSRAYLHVELRRHDKAVDPERLRR